MAELTVAKTYGEALFGAAKDLNKIEEILRDAQDMKVILEKEPDFFSFLTSPGVSAHEKKQILNNIFGDKASEELLNLMCILIDKGRILNFPKIVNAYVDLYNKQEGFSYGKIVSVKPLTPPHLEKFEAETGKLLNIKVKLENEIDTSLIGGVVIYVEGKIIDASVKNRLQSLADSLM